MGIINAKLRILDKVDNTADNTKNVKSAEFPAGFIKRDMNANWGNQDGTLIADWQTANLGNIQFRENNSQLNVVIDGVFYQNEGANPVLDSKNFTSYAAAKDHTHDYIPLSGSANLTGYFFPAEHDQVMLGNPNKAFSQVFAVDFKVVNRDNNTTRLALGSYGGGGFKYSQPAILFWFIPDGGGLKQLTLRTEEITQSRTLKLPDKSGTLTTNTTVSDWNEAITSGFYVSAAGARNAPVSDVDITGNVSATGNMIVQLVYPESNDDTELISYTRKGIKNNDTIIWSKWIKNISTIVDDELYTIKGYDASTHTNLFYKMIPSTVNNIIFTNKEMPSDATLIDVNKNKNGKLVAWVNSKATTMYISTQKVGIKVKANENNYLMLDVWELENVNFSNFDTSDLTNMNQMFSCGRTQVLNMSTIKTDNVTDMSNMFSGTSKLTRIIGMQNWNTSKLINMQCMFQNCNYLQELDMSSFDTSGVTNMRYLFYYCKRLTSITGLIGFDTSNVTDMDCMFAYCEALTDINVSNFDTSNVTNMGQMFCNCSGITSLDIFNFDTSNVTDMGQMFENCTNLTFIQVTNFNTSKVTNMACMFRNCNKIANILGLDQFDTSNATNISSMFEYCSSLTKLDLSNFDTNNIETNYMNNMFKGCDKLTTIVVGNKFKWIATLNKLGLSGTWQDETGKQYVSTDTFPSNVAHTYTKVS